MAALTAAGSPGGTSSAAPTGTRSVMPSTAVATTGAPSESASRSARGSPSQVEVETTQEAIPTRAGMSSTTPRILTGLPCRFARPTSCCLSGPSPGQGKTTVAVNLAASLAELGLSVVLVDGAVHDPALHEVFGIGNAPGLTSSVRDDADPASLLIPIPSVPGLQVVTAGPRLPTRGEAKLYLQHLQKFCRLGDLVIVDGPALQGGAAAGMVVSATDAVVLVVPSGLAWPEVVGADLRILEQHGTPVLGTVLTAADGTAHVNGQRQEGNSYPVSGKASQRPGADKAPGP